MTEFDTTCDVYIGHSAYVWAGQGENICKQKIKQDGQTVLDPEGWIRTMETTNRSGYSSHKDEYDENANRAIKTYRRRISEGNNPVYGVDCSGYTCKVLEALGIIAKGADYNTKGLYNLCDSHPVRGDLQKGDLVFHSKNGKIDGIHHVGFYMGGEVVSESRGRDTGVVETAFDDHPANWKESWNMFGRLSVMAAHTVDIPEYPTEPILITKGAEGEAFAKLQDTLNNLGYKDDEGKTLVVDGKCGKRTIQAWDRAVELNTDAAELHTVTVGLDGQIVYSVEV